MTLWTDMPIYWDSMYFTHLPLIHCAKPCMYWYVVNSLYPWGALGLFQLATALFAAFCLFRTYAHRPIDVLALSCPMILVLPWSYQIIYESLTCSLLIMAVCAMETEKRWASVPAFMFASLRETNGLMLALFFAPWLAARKRWWEIAMIVPLGLAMVADMWTAPIRKTVLASGVWNRPMSLAVLTEPLRQPSPLFCQYQECYAIFQPQWVPYFHVMLFLLGMALWKRAGSVISVGLMLVPWFGAVIYHIDPNDPSRHLAATVLCGYMGTAILATQVLEKLRER